MRLEALRLWKRADGVKEFKSRGLQKQRGGRKLREEEGVLGLGLRDDMGRECPGIICENLSAFAGRRAGGSDGPGD